MCFGAKSYGKSTYLVARVCFGAKPCGASSYPEARVCFGAKLCGASSYPLARVCLGAKSYGKGWVDRVWQTNLEALQSLVRAYLSLCRASLAF